MYYLCKQNNSQLYMTDFKSLAQMRRSHRKFTSEEIDPEALKLILRAALMSPTSKSQRAWHFVWSLTTRRTWKSSLMQRIWVASS